MTYRIRIILVALVVAIIGLSLATPAHSAQSGKHAYRNHGRHMTASTHSQTETQVAASTPVGSACKSSEQAPAAMRNHVGVWTLADVEAYIGCAGVQQSMGLQQAVRYVWDQVKGGTLTVTVVDGVIKDTFTRH